MENNLWNIFKNKVCINLITQEERYNYSKKIFNDHNIKNVEYYRPKKDPEGGLKGCFESHISVIKRAYENGYDDVLIFEDDIIIQNFKHDEMIEKFLNFFKLYPDWDIINLCYFPNFPKDFGKKINKTKIKYFLKNTSICTHAYLVNRKCMEKLKDLKWSKIDLDHYYINNVKEFYSIEPPLAIQNDYMLSDTFDNKILKTLGPRIKHKLSRSCIFVNNNLLLIIMVFLIMIIYFKIK